MLNRFSNTTNIEILERVIQDAELRAGQYIINGGNSEDIYIKKQREVVLAVYERIEELEVEEK